MRGLTALLFLLFFLNSYLYYPNDTNKPTKEYTTMSKQFKTNKKKLEKAKAKITKLLAGIPHHHIDQWSDVDFTTVDINTPKDVPEQEFVLSVLDSHLAEARRVHDRHVQWMAKSKSEADEAREAAQLSEIKANAEKENAIRKKLATEQKLKRFVSAHPNRRTNSTGHLRSNTRN